MDMDRLATRSAKTRAPGGPRNGAGAPSQLAPVAASVPGNSSQRPNFFNNVLLENGHAVPMGNEAMTDRMP
jgi:hypothetical protein